MKKSFAKFNMGGFEYKAKEESNPTLFDDIDKKDRGDSCPQCLINQNNSTQHCKECFLERFKGKTISYGDLLDEIIDMVPLTESSIKKALQDLEKEDKIKVDPTDKRERRGGINETDNLIFLN